MKKIILKTLTTLSVAASFMGAMNGATAATATGVMNVKTTLAAACKVTTTSVSFGPVVPANTGNATANGSLIATCTSGTNYNITFGSGNTGDPNNRFMQGTGSNTDKLFYNIYLDNGYSTVASSFGTGRIFSTGTGATQTFPIYGRMPLNQFLRIDSYTDQSSINLNF